MNQFKDFVSIVNNKVPVDKRNKFIDKVLESMDKQKKDGVEDVNGLQVRIAATHAGRLTGHYHFYQPKKIRKGIASFITPFPKPVLVNHDTSGDPLGRIKSATYIDTPNSMIPASVHHAANTDSLEDSVKKELAYIKKISKHLNDRTFEGLGYASVVANITDEKAIPKILDGRYHTVSVGYDTDSLNCSICLQDWLQDGPCEHKKGHMYDGMRMFLIFGDLNYGELSYVNEPADELAGNEEVKRVIIPLKDSLRGVTKDKISNLVKSALSDMLIEAPERVASTKQGLYLYDSLSQDFIPVDTETEQNSGEYQRMTINDLTSLSNADFKEKLSFFLPEALKDEDLSKHEDADFVGANKTFPAFDKEHIDACRKLLETVDDSDDKKEILSYLDTREIKIDSQSTEIPQTNETPESTETNDSTQKTDKTETTDNKSATYTFEIGKDMKVTLPTEMCDDVKKAITKSIKLNDFISYSFNLGVNGGTWQSEDSKEPEKEIEILKVLMGLYEEETKEGVKDSLSKKTDEEKADYVKKLADSLNIKLADSNLEVTIANQRKEYTLVQETVKDLKGINDKLSDELKDFYVEKILLYSSKDDKENPDASQSDSKEVFKDKNLGEIKATYQIMKNLFDKKNSDSQEVTEVQDPSVKFEKSYTDEDFKKMKDNIDRTYQTIKSVHGDDIANNYKDRQYATLQSLINKSQTQN